MDVCRKFFPPVLKSLKLDYGAMKWYMKQDNSLLVVAFRDKKAKKNCVVVTSNGNVATKTIVPLTNMNGCGRADQQVQYYGMHKRKMYKWRKKKFCFLLELTVINASIIHNMKRLAVGMKKLELVNFKNMLIQQLTEAACIERQEAPREIQVPIQALDRLAPESHFLGSLKKDRNCCVCSGPGNRKRMVHVCATCPGKPHLCKGNCFKIRV